MTNIPAETVENNNSNHQQKQQLKIVIVGHVDHGKSTLIGRMFYDTDSLPEGKFEQISKMCEKRGMPFEWSFLLDSLQAERDQGITIDTTQIWFKTAKRDYVIIDAPGHKEFLKNMVSGAAASDAALLIIDAHEGVKEQSRRHGYLLHLLGVKQIVVALNKMDMVEHSESRYQDVKAEYEAYLASIGVEAKYFIPISARNGDNIASKSENMSWYNGPTITEALDNFEPTTEADNLPLRFPVQDVYKFDERRIIAGRIESGSLQVGDDIIFSPSNTVAKIATIEGINEHNKQQSAHAGISVGITLTEQIFVERGHIASHVNNDELPILTNIFRAKIFWLGKEPLSMGKRYKVKIHTSEFQCELKAIERIVNTDDLESDNDISDEVAKNNVAEVLIRIKGMVALDEFADNPNTGRFVIMDGYHVAGGGIIDMQGLPDQRVEISKGAQSQQGGGNIHPTSQQIIPAERARLNGHLGGILWLTGLSGSGKTTISQQLSRRLFEKGYQVFVLDGDNIRSGINKDLDFSPEGRAENIRRVAEIAKLFADAGVIVITAFISPYTTDRRLARAVAPEYFHTIYVKATVESCKKRDPKGLYAKAIKGEIAEFTGISSPYEPPEVADLILDTENSTIEESVSSLYEYVINELVKPTQNGINADNYEGWSPVI